MGVHKKGGLVGGFDQLRAPDAPTISVSAGDASVTVTITNPSDVGGGDITSYAVSALTGPIEDTTFAVTVVSDGGNKYAIDGTTQATLTLYKGHTYIFDQSDSSNSGHPLRLSTTSNGTHGGGSEYTTGVTTSGSPGSAGAFTKIAIATDAPSTLYYYCTNHSGMGGTANLKASLQSGASGSSSPITVSSLTNDEAYNVRASAINAFGQSPYSDATSATPVLNNGRAVFCGGSTGSQTDTMDYIEINTAGNATDFGDLTANAQNSATMSSSTRGVIQSGSDSNILQYITIASTGNATDFGDATQNRQNIPFGASNSTRGINGGGLQNSVYRDQVDYITIASTGNAQDFGDLTQAAYGLAGCGSSTRSVRMGGLLSGAASGTNTIDYVAIASTGNFTDFGDLNETRQKSAGASNSTRGLCAGSADVYNGVNSIEYITIASTGNGTDFGDLTGGLHGGCAGAGVTIAVIALGLSGGSFSNVINQVTIASTGNATDFGDLSLSRFGMGHGAVTSNHGGLQ
jgi:hypothetical protein